MTTPKMKHTPISLIECPRDAMQGIAEFIPTEVKLKYLRQLIKVGFSAIDFGSFVSPKAMPQMRDTAELLDGLGDTSEHELIAIVANLRGAEDAISFPQITHLGFPLSISEIFQQRNTKKNIDAAWQVVERLQAMVVNHQKKLIVYLSMAFGNPYEEPYQPSLLRAFIERLRNIGVETIMISDTIGAASPDLIKEVFSQYIPQYPQLEIGTHLHATPVHQKEKIMAALQSGVRRFDGAIGGYGGCPMAKEELTGNLDTLQLIHCLKDQDVNLALDEQALAKAKQLNQEIFNQYL